MARGSLERHRAALCARLRERHQAARAALARAMPAGVRWTTPDGGFALWLSSELDGGVLAATAARRGVLVTPGSAFDPQRRPSSAVRLSLSRTEPAQIAAGIDILAACVRDQLASRAAASRSPFLL
jgi:DNA-binding transcriptional MocR family regulator